MDESVLAQLSEEQQAVLTDELKDVFCMLSAADQAFFAGSFQPKDLPTVLARKADILKRDRTNRETMARLVQTNQAKTAESMPPGEGSGGDILAAAAGALGLGAAAAVVATDNTAFYRGVRPGDLIPALTNEFQNSNTSFGASGSADALTGTVFLLTRSGRIPAMTINLTAENDGVQVKVNELTTKGLIETLKDGAGHLFEMAQDGLNLLRRSEGGLTSAGDMLGSAKEVLDGGAELADVVGNLKLKERAWEVIKQTAEAVEAAYRDRVEKERRVRSALESAWDNYYNCSTCSVPFGPEDTGCRVCGTARPEKPQTPDPRQV